MAQWTIQHMQDRTGYFYYRRYSSWLASRARNASVLLARIGQGAILPRWDCVHTPFTEYFCRLLPHFMALR